VPAWITTFDLVLCTSVLEHVTDVHTAAATLRQLTAAGGYLLITVPRSYPPHRSPIDTGYRPTNRDIESLFSDLAVVHSEIIRPPRDKWFHWLIFPPGVSIPCVSCVLLRKVSIVR
jgi:SAM-dependent methyltransferase